MGIIDKVKNSGAAKSAAKKANEYMNPEEKNQQKESDLEKNKNLESERNKDINNRNSNF